jgi:putative endonuclease
VTGDLVRRTWEHRNGLIEGFTKRYGVHRLVYFEVHGSMTEAIQREKRIKKWKRVWKIDLIEKANPEWRDLWLTILGDREVDSRVRGNDRRGDLDE